jgi:hypothetical protein
VRLTAPGSRAPELRRPVPGPPTCAAARSRRAARCRPDHTRAAPTTPRAVDSRSTPVRARTYLRRRTWRGARRDRGALHACQYFTRTRAARPRSSPRVGPAAPGMTSLTRCTAARGTCKSVLRGRADGCHLTDTPPAPSEEEPRFAWSGPIWAYIRLRPQPARPPSSSARTPDPNWRAMVFAAAAAVLCCCTSPWNCGLGLSNYASDLGWSYGDSTPDLLRAIQWQHVHPRPSVQVTVSGRPHESPGIQAGCCTFVLYRSRQQRCILRGGSYLWLAPPGDAGMIPLQ